MMYRMPCGHPYDALVWDDDIKKEVCSACQSEAVSTSHIAKMFTAQKKKEQKEHKSEDTLEEHLRGRIIAWRESHLSDPTRGLDALMGVIKQVYGGVKNEDGD